MAAFRALVILGTRPEAIKLSPLILELRKRTEFNVRVCVTAQHRALLDQMLEVFGIVPDFDLDLMRPNQSLAESTAGILTGLESVITRTNPDIILVQGDTTTTFCGALSGFYQKIPVGHVEAGLRSWDTTQPFPEEMNRVLATRIASLHFAATEWAARNLCSEGVDGSRIVVTGNTGIDAVFRVLERLGEGVLRRPEWPWLDAEKKLIVVTAHRRESFGEGLERICAALMCLAKRKDVQIVYPVHPNPNISEPVRRRLAGAKNIVLIEPAGYIQFVDLMRRSYLLITDSGGIQEEAPSLGKPVLVLREKTERPEAVEAGTAKLVGTSVQRILDESVELLEHREHYERMSRIHNPYGDGQASGRILDAISSFLSGN